MYKIRICFKSKIHCFEYELVIHNSVSLIWPKASGVGCRFHLSQAWWRENQNLGLGSMYKDQKRPEKICDCNIGVYNKRLRKLSFEV